MKKKKITAVLLISSIIIGIPFACKTHKAVLDCSTTESSYSKDIAPLVLSNCMPCHSSGSLKGDFTTYAGLNAVAASGDLKTKVLVRKEMPPTGPLAADLQKKIACWLNNGHPNN